jgi:hypothetical protein
MLKLKLISAGTINLLGIDISYSGMLKLKLISAGTINLRKGDYQDYHDVHAKYCYG